MIDSLLSNNSTNLPCVIGFVIEFYLKRDISRMPIDVSTHLGSIYTTVMLICIITIHKQSSQSQAPKMP